MTEGLTNQRVSPSDGGYALIISILMLFFQLFFVNFDPVKHGFSIYVERSGQIGGIDFGFVHVEKNKVTEHIMSRHSPVQIDL